MLYHLGEALVPNVDQAIIELVKNAFDADATTCVVTIDGTPDSELTIRLEDNGVGMSAADIQSN